MKCILTLMAWLMALSQVARCADFIDFVRDNNIPVYDIEIQSELPHNPASYTQGLLIHDGVLYESTGLYGQSTLQKLDPATGTLLESAALDPDLFGEGIAFGNGHIVQLTWREKLALVWQTSLTRTGTYFYDTEGWGLTSDGRYFYMSDGRPWLFRRSLENFSLVDSLIVTVAGRSITGMNELEYVDGKIYANFLGGDFIAEIDPASGVVSGVIDASVLRNKIGKNPLETPLNGIAYDPETREFLLTGKLWPKIYRVRFITGFGR